eukprot:15334152-Ditylum_brightwellii.AAC.1
MEGVVTKSNKPLVLKLFLNEDNWSLAFICHHLVPSSSVNTALAEAHLTVKYVKVIKAGVDDLGKKPIAVVEHCLQQIHIDAFMEELGLQQLNGAND